MVLNGFPVPQIDSDLGVGRQASLGELIIFYFPEIIRKPIYLKRKLEKIPKTNPMICSMRLL